MKQRVTALLLAVLVGLPWAVMPAAAGSACAKSAARAAAASRPSCSYCVSDSRSASALPSIGAGCCRFAAPGDLNPAQAGGVSLTPKPRLSPEAPAAALAGSFHILAPRDARVAPRSAHRGASHAPPTETTHLLR